MDHAHCGPAHGGYCGPLQGFTTTPTGCEARFHCDASAEESLASVESGVGYAISVTVRLAGNSCTYVDDTEALRGSEPPYESLGHCVVAGRCDLLPD